MVGLSGRHKELRQRRSEVRITNSIRGSHRRGATRYRDLRLPLRLEHHVSEARVIRSCSVLQEAAKQDWILEHVDVVITLEKPKLGAQKIKMKKNLAKLLNISLENVSIKAKTAEGLGAEGQGQAISCSALVTMKKG